MSEVARNARQASRLLDEIVRRAPSTDMAHGIDLTGPLARTGHRPPVLADRSHQRRPARSSLPTAKADNQIIGVVMHLARSFPKRAGHPGVQGHQHAHQGPRAGPRSAGLLQRQGPRRHRPALHRHPRTAADFWDTHGKGLESWKKDSRTYYRIKGPLCPDRLLVNEFVWQEGPQPLQAWVRRRRQDGRTRNPGRLQPRQERVWGITARNREQNFALNLLMNPEIDFVTLLGQAGTGKTLLTLAAALTQTLETKLFSEIIITRVTVPVGEDIGFLPGTEEEKMTPWMGALEDNLDVLNKPAESPRRQQQVAVTGGVQATMDLMRSRIKIKSLNFMRGRTFMNKFLIIDEAQNLTPKQMKTLITRAGPGTKVVCLGNIAQIDTPYLTEGSSGLTYVVDRFKGWLHSGHITLQRGERSRLADHAADVL
jgi:PhoH-like ATPase